MERFFISGCEKRKCLHDSPHAVVGFTKGFIHSLLLHVSERETGIYHLLLHLWEGLGVGITTGQLVVVSIREYPVGVIACQDLCKDFVKTAVSLAVCVLIKKVKLLNSLCSLCR